MRQILLFTSAVGLMALFVTAAVWASGGLSFLNSFGCNDNERRVFAEFDHYGGREVELFSNPTGGFCTAKYTAEASEQEILDYYEGQLREHGWSVTVQPSRQFRELPEDVRREMTSDGKVNYVPSASLRGERGKFGYSVRYEKEGTGHAPENASRISISIFEDTS